MAARDNRRKDMRYTKLMLSAAALAVIVPGAASAGTGGANAVDTSYGNPQPQEDDDFPWGLLGLLGLAGLIPRKRRDDIHVDNRTGTGPRT
jgi:MYXO-CTERM domain-containing protein